MKNANTMTSMSNSFSRLTSSTKHPATAITIWLLTMAIKFRKTGLIFLVSAFLINGYFMLFDQLNYIAFLTHYFSPDGHISDINSVFFKVQISIFLFAVFWILIDQPSIDLIKERSLPDKGIQTWRQSPLLYFSTCIIWMICSYLTFLVLDSETLINSIREDGFFQICGALFLFIASILFFSLYYLDKKYQNNNVWFFLLGLLFFIGAGEEINWGQQIFNFATPAFMSSNIQHEFSLHNLPLLDGRSAPPTFDQHGIQIVKLNSGWIKTHLTASYLFIYFCTLSLIILPILYLLNTKARSILNYIKTPIASIYFGIIYIIELKTKEHIEHYFTLMNTHSILITDWHSAINYHKLAWATVEIHETFDSFLFVMVAIWLIQNISNEHQKD